MKPNLIVTLLVTTCLGLTGCNDNDSGSTSNLLTDNETGTGDDISNNQEFGSVDNDNTGDPLAPGYLRGVDPFKNAIEVSSSDMEGRLTTESSVTVLNAELEELTQAFDVIEIAENEVLALQTGTDPVKLNLKSSSNTSNATMMTVSGRITIR